MFGISRIFYCVHIALGVVVLNAAIVVSNVGNEYLDLYNFMGNNQGNSNTVIPNSINQNYLSKQNSELNKINIASFLANRYMGQKVRYFDQNEKVFKNGMVKGIVKKSEKEYYVIMQDEQKLKVIFESNGEATPSNRLQQAGMAEELQYKLMMQQMLSNSLSPIMSGSNESSSITNLAPQYFADQNPYQSQQGNEKVSFFTDKSIQYIDRKSQYKRTGIPDYLSQEMAIILKDGTKLIERFVKTHGN